jgi:Mg-chelatase subunit ChlD
MRCFIRSLFPAVCAIALAAAGCNEPGLRTSDKHRTYNASGKTIVVVIDVSGSMNQNDPNRAALEGALLIAGLAEQGDNVACITFSSDARVVAPLRTISSPDDRRELCREVANVRREGSTNFVAALGRARDILEDVAAPAGSTVLFMTDGEHNTGGTEADVLDQVKAFRDRGWKIQCLGYQGVLGEAHTPLLAQMAARTAGGFYVATKPRELLEDYIKITGELQDILVTNEIEKPARLFPGTSRLIYVVLKGEKTTRLTSVMRDGQPVALDGPTVFHFPGPDETSKSFDIFRTQDPPAGRWNGAVDGPYEVAYVMMKAPFEFSLAPGAPKREQVDGRPVTVTLNVKGEAVDQIKNDSNVHASVEDFDGRPVADLGLKLAPSSEKGLLQFTGEFTPHLKDPKTPETHTVKLRFTYRDGEIVWTHDRQVSYQLVPPPAAALEVTPADVDLGPIFAGDGAKQVSVSVRAGGTAAKHVMVQPGADVTANPTELRDLAQPGTVLLGVGPTKFGDFKTSVVFRPEGGDDASTATCTLHGRVVNLRAPSGVQLGDVAAGETASGPLAIEGDDPHVSLLPLEGSKGGKLTMRAEGGKLLVDIPRDAPPGSYKGTLDVTVAGATKHIPVSLTVTAPQARLSGLPEKVAASFKSAAQGHASASFPVKLEAADPCAVTLTWTDLKPAAGGPPYAKNQLKVTLDGLVDGKLAPGGAAALKADGYVGLNVLPGTYQGELTVVLKQPDGKQTTKKLPIELEVAR